MKNVPLVITSAALLAFSTASVNATITELFGPTVTDLSGWDVVKDDGGTGLAVVSVVGGAGSEKLSLLDNSGGDKPEVFADFADGNVLDGLHLSFDVAFDNASLTTLVSDPEIRLRFGNLGVDATSDAKTGFAMIFRHEDTDSTNQVRAGQWNGTDKVSSTSSGLGSYTNVADGLEFSVEIFANNAYTAQTYNAGANTLAANTYDLYIDAAFIGNYALGEDTAEFDRDLGFGTIGFLGSSDSDLGVALLVDNVILSTGADNGLTAVPEPSTFAAIAGMLALASVICRRKRS